MVKYVEMTADEAVKLRGGDTKVLVSVIDNEQSVSEFMSKKFADCENIIMNSDVIQHSFDDFVEQLRVLSFRYPKDKKTAIFYCRLLENEHTFDYHKCHEEIGMSTYLLWCVHIYKFICKCTHRSNKTHIQK